MNYLKFFTGILVLILAFFLQFWLGVWGIYANFVFATLIVFVFLFDIGEFIFFVLLGVFLINWQPMASIDIIAFAIIPLIAFAARFWFHWDQWVGSVASVVIALLLLYFVISPKMIIQPFGSFIVDLLLSIIFAEAILWGMQ